VTTWIRVQQDGVGKWSQSIDIPLRDGQEWLRDEPAATAQGAPLPPAPDDTHLDGDAPRGRTEPPRATDDAATDATGEAGSTQPQGSPATSATPAEGAAADTSTHHESRRRRGTSGNKEN
jgi:hypothetical protein